MFKLQKKNYKSAYKIYKDNSPFFPLIAAVLMDKQDGVVYADNAESPSKVYVEHRFGFSQLFGKSISSSAFLHELENYLLIDKKFHASKIRLYSPYTPDFLLTPRPNVSLSERQRFHLDYQLYLDRKKIINSNEVEDIQLCGVGKENVALIEKEFVVVNRFWRSQRDFLEMANTCLVLYKNKPASICYSAATADGYAEIDVLSLPEYRNIGLAGYAVIKFIEKCYDSNIQPLWDCYTNNDPSMTLAHSIGFIPYNSPYKFFTINK